MAPDLGTRISRFREKNILSHLMGPESGKKWCPNPGGHDPGASSTEDDGPKCRGSTPPELGAGISVVSVATSNVWSHRIPRAVCCCCRDCVSNAHHDNAQSTKSTHATRAIESAPSVRTPTLEEANDIHNTRYDTCMSMHASLQHNSSTAVAAVRR